MADDEQREEDVRAVTSRLTAREMAFAASLIPVLVAPIAGLWASRPFARMFEEMGMCLPAITRLVLSPFWPIAILVLIAGTIMLAFFVPKSRWPLVCWNVCLGPLLIMGLIMCLLLPLFTPMQQLGQQGAP